MKEDVRQELEDATVRRVTVVVTEVTDDEGGGEGAENEVAQLIGRIDASPGFWGGFALVLCGFILSYALMVSSLDRMFVWSSASVFGLLSVGVVPVLGLWGLLKMADERNKRLQWLARESIGNCAEWMSYGAIDETRDYIESINGIRRWYLWASTGLTLWMIATLWVIQNALVEVHEQYYESTVRTAWRLIIPQ